MARKYVETLLADALDEYVDHFDESSLEIGLWDGDIALTNLSVKPMEWTLAPGINLALEYCHVDKIQMQIPWMELTTGSVSAVIDSCDLVLRVKFVDPNRNTKTHQYSSDMAKVLEEELKLLSAEPSGWFSGMVDSFGTKVIAHITKGFSLSIDRLKCSLLLPTGYNDYIHLQLYFEALDIDPLSKNGPPPGADTSSSSSSQKKLLLSKDFSIRGCTINIGTESIKCPTTSHEFDSLFDHFDPGDMFLNPMDILAHIWLHEKKKRSRSTVNKLSMEFNGVNDSSDDDIVDDNSHNYYHGDKSLIDDITISISTNIKNIEFTPSLKQLMSINKFIHYLKFMELVPKLAHLHPSSIARNIKKGDDNDNDNGNGNDNDNHNDDDSEFRDADDNKSSFYLPGQSNNNENSSSSSGSYRVAGSYRKVGYGFYDQYQQQNDDDGISKQQIRGYPTRSWWQYAIKSIILLNKNRKYDARKSYKWHVNNRDDTDQDQLDVEEKERSQIHYERYERPMIYMQLYSKYILHKLSFLESNPTISSAFQSFGKWSSSPRVFTNIDYNVMDRMQKSLNYKEIIALRRCVHKSLINSGESNDHLKAVVEAIAATNSAPATASIPSTSSSFSVGNATSTNPFDKNKRGPLSTSANTNGNNNMDTYANDSTGGGTNAGIFTDGKDNYIMDKSFIEVVNVAEFEALYPSHGKPRKLRTRMDKGIGNSIDYTKALKLDMSNEWSDYIHKNGEKSIALNLEIALERFAIVILQPSNNNEFRNITKVNDRNNNSNNNNINNDNNNNNDNGATDDDISWDRAFTLLLYGTNLLLNNEEKSENLICTLQLGSIVAFGYGNVEILRCGIDSAKWSHNFNNPNESERFQDYAIEFHLESTSKYTKIDSYGNNHNHNHNHSSNDNSLVHFNHSSPSKYDKDKNTKRVKETDFICNIKQIIGQWDHISMEFLLEMALTFKPALPLLSPITTAEMRRNYVLRNENKDLSDSMLISLQDSYLSLHVVLDGAKFALSNANIIRVSGGVSSNQRSKSNRNRGNKRPNSKYSDMAATSTPKYSRQKNGRKSMYSYLEESVVIEVGEISCISGNYLENWVLDDETQDENDDYNYSGSASGAGTGNYGGDNITDTKFISFMAAPWDHVNQSLRMLTRTLQHPLLEPFVFHVNNFEVYRLTQNSASMFLSTNNDSNNNNNNNDTTDNTIYGNKSKMMREPWSFAGIASLCVVPWYQQFTDTRLDINFSPLDIAISQDDVIVTLECFSGIFDVMKLHNQGNIDLVDAAAASAAANSRTKSSSSFTTNDNTLQENLYPITELRYEVLAPVCKFHLNCALSHVNIALTDETENIKLSKHIETLFYNYGKHAMKRGLDCQLMLTQKNILRCQIQQVLPPKENFNSACEIINVFIETLRQSTIDSDDDLRREIMSSVELVMEYCQEEEEEEEDKGISLDKSGVLDLRLTGLQIDLHNYTYDNRLDLRFTNFLCLGGQQRLPILRVHDDQYQLRDQEASIREAAAIAAETAASISAGVSTRHQRRVTKKKQTPVKGPTTIEETLEAFDDTLSRAPLTLTFSEYDSGYGTGWGGVPSDCTPERRSNKKTEKVKEYRFMQVPDDTRVIRKGKLDINALEITLLVHSEVIPSICLNIVSAMEKVSNHMHVLHQRNRDLVNRLSKILGRASENSDNNSGNYDFYKYNDHHTYSGNSNIRNGNTGNQFQGGYGYRYQADASFYRSRTSTQRNRHKQAEIVHVNVDIPREFVPIFEKLTAKDLNKVLKNTGCHIKLPSYHYDVSSDSNSNSANSATHTRTNSNHSYHYIHNHNHNDKNNNNHRHSHDQNHKHNHNRRNSGIKIEISGTAAQVNMGKNILHNILLRGYTQNNKVKSNVVACIKFDSIELLIGSGDDLFLSLNIDQGVIDTYIAPSNIGSVKMDISIYSLNLFDFSEIGTVHPAVLWRSELLDTEESMFSGKFLSTDSNINRSKMYYENGKRYNPNDPTKMLSMILRGARLCLLFRFLKEIKIFFNEKLGDGIVAAMKGQNIHSLDGGGGGGVGNSNGNGDGNENFSDFNSSDNENVGNMSNDDSGSTSSSMYSSSSESDEFVEVDVGRTAPRHAQNTAFRNYSLNEHLSPVPTTTTTTTNNNNIDDGFRYPAGAKSGDNTASSTPNNNNNNNNNNLSNEEKNNFNAEELNWLKWDIRLTDITIILPRNSCSRDCIALKFDEGLVNNDKIDVPVSAPTHLDAANYGKPIHMDQHLFFSPETNSWELSKSKVRSRGNSSDSNTGGEGEEDVYYDYPVVADVSIDTDSTSQTPSPRNKRGRGSISPFSNDSPFYSPTGGAAGAGSGAGANTPLSSMSQSPGISRLNSSRIMKFESAISLNATEMAAADKSFASPQSHPIHNHNPNSKTPAFRRTGSVEDWEFFDAVEPSPEVKSSPSPSHKYNHGPLPSSPYYEPGPEIEYKNLKTKRVSIDLQGVTIYSALSGSYLTANPAFLNVETGVDSPYSSETARDIAEDPRKWLEVGNERPVYSLKSSTGGYKGHQTRNKSKGSSEEKKSDSDTRTGDDSNMSNSSNFGTSRHNNSNTQAHNTINDSYSTQKWRLITRDLTSKVPFNMLVLIDTQNDEEPDELGKVFIGDTDIFTPLSLQISMSEYYLLQSTYFDNVFEAPTCFISKNTWHVPPLTGNLPLYGTPEYFQTIVNAPLDFEFIMCRGEITLDCFMDIDYFDQDIPSKSCMKIDELLNLFRADPAFISECIFHGNHPFSNVGVDGNTNDNDDNNNNNKNNTNSSNNAASTNNVDSSENAGDSENENLSNDEEWTNCATPLCEILIEGIVVNTASHMIDKKEDTGLLVGIGAGRIEIYDTRIPRDVSINPPIALRVANLKEWKNDVDEKYSREEAAYREETNKEIPEELTIRTYGYADMAYGLTMTPFDSTKPGDIPVKILLVMTKHYNNINIGIDGAELNLKNLDFVMLLIDYFALYYKYPGFGHPMPELVESLGTNGQTKLPYSCIDTRVFATRPFVSIMEDPHVLSSPTLVVETNQGVFYRLLQDDLNNKKMELKVYDAAAIIHKVYDGPHISRGRRGSAGSGRGIRTQIEFLTFEMTNKYDAKNNTNDIMVRMEPLTGDLFGEHRGSSSFRSGSMRNNRSVLQQSKNSWNGRGTNRRNNVQVLKAQYGNDYLHLDAIEILPPKSVYPLDEGKNTTIGVTCDIVTSYEDVLFTLSMISEFLSSSTAVDATNADTKGATTKSTSTSTSTSTSNRNGTGIGTSSNFVHVITGKEVETSKKYESSKNRHSTSKKNSMARHGSIFESFQDSTKETHQHIPFSSAAVGSGSGSTETKFLHQDETISSLNTDTANASSYFNQLIKKTIKRISAASKESIEKNEQLEKEKKASTFAIVKLEGIKCVVVDNVLGLHLPLVSVILREFHANISRKRKERKREMRRATTYRDPKNSGRFIKTYRDKNGFLSPNMWEDSDPDEKIFDEDGKPIFNTNIYLKVNMWADYFNNLKKCWEPLLEKLKANVSFEQGASRGEGIIVRMESPIQINISGAFFSTLNDLLRMFESATTTSENHNHNHVNGGHSSSGKIEGGHLLSESSNLKKESISAGAGAGAGSGSGSRISLVDHENDKKNEVLSLVDPSTITKGNKSSFINSSHFKHLRTSSIQGTVVGNGLILPSGHTPQEKAFYGAFQAIDGYNPKNRMGTFRVNPRVGQLAHDVGRLQSSSPPTIDIEAKYEKAAIARNGEASPRRSRTKSVRRGTHFSGSMTTLAHGNDQRDYEKYIETKKNIKSKSGIRHVKYPPLPKDSRFGFSLNNSTGQSVRFLQQNEAGRDMICYLDDGHRGALNFVASSTRIRNNNIIREGFNVQMENAGRGFRHTKAPVTRKMLSVQISGYKWLLKIQADELGVKFEDIYPLKVVNQENAKQFLQDWQIKNALKLVVEVLPLDGGRVLQLRSVFSIVNNTSHALDVYALAKELHSGGNDSTHDAMGLNDLPFTLNVNDTFHVPLALLQRASTSTNSASFGFLKIKPNDIVAAEKELGKRADKEYGIEVGYTANSINLAKAIENTEKWFKILDRSHTNKAKDIQKISMVQMGCPIKSRLRKRIGQNHVYDNGGYSPATMKNQKLSSTASKLPPFCYNIEIQRVAYGTMYEPRAHERTFIQGLAGRLFRSRQQDDKKRYQLPVYYNLVVHPPIVLENLLACRGLFEVLHADQGRVLWSGTVEPGMAVPIHTVSLEEPLRLRINLTYCRTVDPQVRIHTPIRKEDNQRTFVDKLQKGLEGFLDDDHRPEEDTSVELTDTVGQRLRLHIENIEGGGGQRHVAVYCPYWIVNTSQYQVRIREEGSPRDELPAGTVTPGKDGTASVAYGALNPDNGSTQSKSSFSDDGAASPTGESKRRTSQFGVGTIFPGKKPAFHASRDRDRSSRGSEKEGGGSLGKQVSRDSKLKALFYDLKFEDVVDMAYMYNYPDSNRLIGKRRVLIQMEDGDWSEPMSLDSVGTPFVAQVEHASRGMLEMGYKITVAPGRLAKYTKIVRFMPRFIFVNKIDTTLSFTQPAGFMGETQQWVDAAMEVKPFHYCPFHLPDMFTERSLSVQYDGPYYRTVYFKAEDAGIHTVRVDYKLDLARVPHVNTRDAPEYTVLFPAKKDIGLFLETDWGEKNIVVRDFKPGAYCYDETDIQVGDVIIAIDGQPVPRNADEKVNFDEAISILQSRTSTIEVGIRTVEENIRRVREAAVDGMPQQKKYKKDDNDNDDINQSNVTDDLKLKDKVLRLEITQVEASIFIAVGEIEANEKAEYMFVNDSTAHWIHYKQKGVLGNNWCSLAPGSSIPYTWENPFLPHKLIIKAGKNVLCPRLNSQIESDFLPLNNNLLTSGLDCIAGVAGEEFTVVSLDEIGANDQEIFLRDGSEGRLLANISVAGSTKTLRIGACERLQLRELQFSIQFLGLQCDLLRKLKLNLSNMNRTHGTPNQMHRKSFVAHQQSTIDDIENLDSALNELISDRQTIENAMESSSLGHEADGFGEMTPLVASSPVESVLGQRISALNQLQVEVIEANELRPFVIGKKEDIYVSVDVHRDLRRTEMVTEAMKSGLGITQHKQGLTYMCEKNMSPSFVGQKFLFDVPPEAVERKREFKVVVRVMTDSVIRPLDKILGQADIQFTSLVKEEEFFGWFPLRSMKNNITSSEGGLDICGSIKLRVQWVHSELGLSQCTYDKVTQRLHEIELQYKVQNEALQRMSHTSKSGSLATAVKLGVNEDRFAALALLDNLDDSLFNENNSNEQNQGRYRSKFLEKHKTFNDIDKFKSDLFPSVEDEKKKEKGNEKEKEKEKEDNKDVFDSGFSSLWPTIDDNTASSATDIFDGKETSKTVSERKGGLSWEVPTFSNAARDESEVSPFAGMDSGKHMFNDKKFSSNSNSKKSKYRARSLYVTSNSKVKANLDSDVFIRRGGNNFAPLMNIDDKTPTTSPRTGTNTRLESDKFTGPRVLPSHSFGKILCPLPVFRLKPSHRWKDILNTILASKLDESDITITSLAQVVPVESTEADDSHPLMNDATKQHRTDTSKESSGRIASKSMSTFIGKSETIESPLSIVRRQFQTIMSRKERVINDELVFIKTFEAECERAYNHVHTQAGDLDITPIKALHLPGSMKRSMFVRISYGDEKQRTISVKHAADLSWHHDDGQDYGNDIDNDDTNPNVKRNNGMNNNDNGDPNASTLSSNKNGNSSKSSRNGNEKNNPIPIPNPMNPNNNLDIDNDASPTKRFEIETLNIKSLLKIEVIDDSFFKKKIVGILEIPIFNLLDCLCLSDYVSSSSSSSSSSSEDGLHHIHSNTMRKDSNGEYLLSTYTAWFPLTLHDDTISADGDMRRSWNNPISEQREYTKLPNGTPCIKIKFQWKRKVLDSSSDRSITNLSKRYMRFQLPYISMALIDSVKARELMQWSIFSTEARQVVSTKFTDTTANIMWTQIDNQLPDQISPVLMSPSAMKNPQPTVRFHVRKNNELSKDNLTSYDTVQLVIQTLDMRLEQQTVVATWALIKSWGQQQQQKQQQTLAGDINSDGTITGDADDDKGHGDINTPIAALGFATCYDTTGYELLPTLSSKYSKSSGKSDKSNHSNSSGSGSDADDEKMVYIGFMNIGPIKINASFIMNPNIASGSSAAQKRQRTTMADNDSTSSMLLFFSLVGEVALDITSSIADAPITLPVFKRNTIFETEYEVNKRLRQHYLYAALTQLYKIVGSLELVGNPVALVSSLGTGVKDFFYEPSNALITSPTQVRKITRGVMKGTVSLLSNTAEGVLGTGTTITRSFGRGVSKLSMDQSFVSSREILNRPPRSNFEAGMRPFKDILNGVYCGVVGIIKVPYFSWKRNSPYSSVAVAFAQGIAGAAAKPIVGVLDGITHGGEALRNSLRVITREQIVPVCRIRFSNQFGPDGRMLPYVYATALGTKVLETLDRLDFEGGVGNVLNESRDFVARLLMTGGADESSLDKNARANKLANQKSSRGMMSLWKNGKKRNILNTKNSNVDDGDDVDDLFSSDNIDKNLEEFVIHVAIVQKKNHDRSQEVLHQLVIITTERVLVVDYFKREGSFPLYTLRWGGALNLMRDPVLEKSSMGSITIKLTMDKDGVEKAVADSNLFAGTDDNNDDGNTGVQSGIAGLRQAVAGSVASAGKTFLVEGNYQEEEVLLELYNCIKIVWSMGEVNINELETTAVKDGLERFGDVVELDEQGVYHIGPWEFKYDDTDDDGANRNTNIRGGNVASISQSHIDLIKTKDLDHAKWYEDDMDIHVNTNKSTKQKKIVGPSWLEEERRKAVEIHGSLISRVKTLEKRNEKSSIFAAQADAFFSPSGASDAIHSAEGAGGGVISGIGGNDNIIGSPDAESNPKEIVKSGLSGLFPRVSFSAPSTSRPPRSSSEDFTRSERKSSALTAVDIALSVERASKVAIDVLSDGKNSDSDNDDQDQDDKNQNQKADTTPDTALSKQALESNIVDSPSDAMSVLSTGSTAMSGQQVDALMNRLDQLEAIMKKMGIKVEPSLEG